MKPLKLIATDIADLEIISAAMQDALAPIGEFRFDKKARRFSAMVQRFRWEQAHVAGPFERVRAALSFESVLGARTLHLRRDAPGALIDILSLKFEPAAEPPGGVARIVLAGGGEIALDVECLDVTLADIGPAWPTPRKPDHEKA